MNTTFFIRVFVADSENLETETGTVGRDFGIYFPTKRMNDTEYFKDKDSAELVVKGILEEKQARMASGEVFPPNGIHRICNMSNRRSKIEFRISVIELNLESISMEEVSYWCGTVSFKNPEIIITAKGWNL